MLTEVGKLGLNAGASSSYTGKLRVDLSVEFYEHQRSEEESDALREARDEAIAERIADLKSIAGMG